MKLDQQPENQATWGIAMEMDLKQILIWNIEKGKDEKNKYQIFCS